MCESHARFTSEGREVYITDLGSKHGTTHNDNPLRPNNKVRLAPGDTLCFGDSGREDTTFKVKMCHNRVWDAIHNGTPLYTGPTEDQEEKMLAA